jgi:CheY-like chemotaxis protein
VESSAIPTVSAKKMQILTSAYAHSGSYLFTLLCIDDEPSINKLHQMIFEAHGYRVILATDGAEGLLLFQQEHVDLVIVDYTMPGMTGAEVAAAIRTSDANLPIVMLSGYIDLPNHVLRDVDQYLIKGQSPPDVMLNTVQSLLARKQKPVS